MKTDSFGKERGGKRQALLPLALLLSACAASPQVVEAEQARHTTATTAPQPAAAAAQKPAPVEAPQPAQPSQPETLPKKRKHNVEED